MSLASQVESALGSAQGVVLDDRRQPLFHLVQRVRDGERSASWHATVVDQELLAQGAPSDVLLQLLPLPRDLAPALVSRALEPCLVDHPRVQLCHSAALPAATLLRVQPAEPSPLLPPLHSLPLCDELGVVVLVKEWSDGTGLLPWRQKRGAGLKLSDISDLTDTVGDALASLHRRGYAHGALTPESIVLQEIAAPIVTGEDESTVWVAKLVDIGLARTLASPGSWPSGPSALWCAPEAFAPDATTDWRKVDQLAVAAVLYALWTDQLPFDAMPPGTPPQQARELRRRQIEALPPPRGNQRARALGVTPAMSAACMRAMAAEPSERFPSLDAFSLALRHAARDYGRKVAAHPEEEPPGRDATNPATSVSAKFRALSVPPQSLPTEPGGLPHIQSRKEIPLASVVVVDEEPPPEQDAEESEQSEGEDESVRHEPTRHAIPSREHLRDDRRKARVTKILTTPGEITGEYPRHPDDEERAEAEEQVEREREEAASDVAVALGGQQKWAFNHLSAVLLALWGLTLVWALMRGGDARGPAASANKAAPAAKAGKAHAAAEEAP